MYSSVPVKTWGVMEGTRTKGGLTGRFSLRTCFSRLCRKMDTSPDSSRFISKDGRVQVKLDEISFGKRQRYWRNPLTTLLDMKWRWIILIFGIGFIATWLTFAIIYYIIAKSRGDMDANLDADHELCVTTVTSFTAAFLFSLETQHTIGYGSRHTTVGCPPASVFVFLQFIVGVAVQCIIAGLVVTKLVMGKRCSNVLLFSDKACVGICGEDICLMLRVGSSGKSQLVGCRGYGLLVERRANANAEEETLDETYLLFQSENDSERLNLLWPAVLHCVITENPAAFVRKLKQDTSELIVTVEGVTESTGKTQTFRTSYLADEIEIGQHFVDISPGLVQTNSGQDYHHEVDYTDFHETEYDSNWTGVF